MVQTTESGHRYPVADILLARNFTPQQLNCVWVSDITFITSKGGWLYLTTILDLADRQSIGWSLSRFMKAEYTSIAAFKQAIVNRPPGFLVVVSLRPVCSVCMRGFYRATGRL